jgi:histidine kinase
MALENVEINRVLNRTYDMFSQQLKVRGIEIEAALAENLPLVKVDPDRLEQVFINLLINARDAIMDRVEVEETPAVEKKIFLITRFEAHKVIVEICDSGVGIPAGMADKIFEPFFTTKEVGKGTGLGLSISYGIVKDFGGRIYTKPRTGGGACFVIQIPA